jgi:hypothetical protein
MTVNDTDEGFGSFWNPEDLARAEQERQQRKETEGAAAAKPNGATSGWGEPDTGVLQLHRRTPPLFPIEVLGDKWGPWVVNSARAAAAPPDYVALPLIAAASTLIGNARWAKATNDWIEPPHIWTAPVGDSGDGKTPGFRPFARHILPALERRMLGDFPERYREWQADVEADKAALKDWQKKVAAAHKNNEPLPERPQPTASDIEPREPCLYMSDVTIEEVASVLVVAAPKGLMITRNELAGWLDGMNAYNPSGRAFWVEAYDGNPHRVGRRKHSGRPINVQRNVVAVCGGTQPERLAVLMAEADDGLLARILWGWPDPVPFKLGIEPSGIVWAIEALDRLRELDLLPGDPPEPVLIPLTAEGQQLIEYFGQEMRERRDNTGGLLRSAYGKARGAALRLGLVLQFLWWCASMEAPPSHITEEAFAAAAVLVSDYFMPMAERVFGDAATSETEHMMTTLARWIVKERPSELHVRLMQRDVRLPGLRTAKQIREAADGLVDVDWLRKPNPGSGFGVGRPPVVYAVNPRLWERVS